MSGIFHRQTTGAQEAENVKIKKTMRFKEIEKIIISDSGPVSKELYKKK